MISILLPIYNGVEFISQSVESVLNQTFSDWELIIGVNGHEKNSTVFQKANKFKSSNVHVLDLDTVGKSKSLNEMVKYAKYDWIALIDVDDMWHPLKLEEQVKFMENYDVIGTRCIYFGDLNIVPFIPVGDISKFDFKTVNPIINSSALIRKEFAIWNEQLPALEDYDMWLRLWKSERRFYNVQGILTLHRIHESSFFNTKKQDVPSLLAMY